MANMHNIFLQVFENVSNNFLRWQLVRGGELLEPRGGSGGGIWFTETMQHLPKVLELDGGVTKVIGVLSTVYDSTMHIFDKAY